jgi:hypothetical protein
MAWVAELVDARDLKSLEGHPSCRFDPGPRHLGETQVPASVVKGMAGDIAALLIRLPPKKPERFLTIINARSSSITGLKGRKGKAGSGFYQIFLRSSSIWRVNYSETAFTKPL